jgi:hypothetical protein
MTLTLGVNAIKILYVTDQAENKLVCLSPAGFQANQIFASKSGAYPSASPYSPSIRIVCSPCQHYTSLEKHSSLFVHLIVCSNKEEEREFNNFVS